jgi:dethiobiotin synthase
MLRYRPTSPALRYWKPVQTGIEQDDDTAEVVRLAGIDHYSVVGDGIRLRQPVSPHLAARRSGAHIVVADLVTTLKEQPPGPVIVEGAGGALVPLNDSELMIDLMSELGLPVLVVARSGLGTINHTLLTVQALRARRLEVYGAVMTGEPDDENRKAIEKYGQVAVIGQLPRMASLTRDSLAEWAASSLDVHWLLASCLT